MAARLARDEGLGLELTQSLVDRHGTEAPELIRRGRAADLLRPLVDGFPHLEAEVAWAAEEEGALSLDDLLARRLRLVQELRDRGEAIAPRVAEIAGDVLDWDTDRQSREVATYLEQAHREYDVPRPA